MVCCLAERNEAQQFLHIDNCAGRDGVESYNEDLASRPIQRGFK